MPTVQELLSAALETHRAGHSAEARALYQEILNANPDHADALHLLGLSSFDQGRYEESLALIGRAIERNPSAAGYHNNLGTCYSSYGVFPRHCCATNGLFNWSQTTPKPTVTSERR